MRQVSWLSPEEAKRRTPRLPRSKEPHVEIIMRLPSGEKVGIWSPWASRIKTFALARKMSRTAARRTREGEVP